jgi:uncharacterized protein DUF3303
MLYMIVERFCGGDAVPVYRRFRDHGRLAPEGLRYVDSWVSVTSTFDMRPQCTSLGVTCNPTPAPSKTGEHDGRSS